MFGRKYPWIVIWSSLASVICLLVGEARFSALAERGWTIGSAWVWWAILPGTFGAAVWSFQRRDWLQLAGVISASGVLLYSVYYLLGAMTTESLNGHAIFHLGPAHFALALGWSLLALLIGRLGTLGNAREQR